MHRVVAELAPDMDAILMAAAVGDYRPAEVSSQKVKKTENDMTVRLVRNPDILADLGRRKPAKQVLAGFAAETENLVANATKKLRSKNLDFIVANDLSQKGCGFGCDTNAVKIIDRRGETAEIPCLSKMEIADRILDRLEALMKKNVADEAGG
jgi:phosphopantothenoylcysteine decarboxylase/phosphopantothenate--cysteine ligase